MNSRTLTVPLLAILLAGSYGSVKQEENEKLAARVELLEARANAIELYLQAQAQTAKVLTVQLEAADEAGFTWGVNPKAHEMVLTSITSFAASTQKNVPGAKPGAADNDK